jgi:vacuolar-type H+-ATPase subunit E/Vma4
MGLQEILKEIYQESDTVNNEALTQAKFQADKMVVERADELDILYKGMRDELEVELKRLSAKMIAKAELDLYREKQRVEVAMIEDVLNEAYAELAENLHKDSAKYLSFLIRLAKGAIQLVGAQGVGFSFSKEDEKYFENIKSELKADVKLLPASKIAGGLICIAGDSYVDNSIDSIYGRMKPGFVRMVSDIIA